MIQFSYGIRKPDKKYPVLNGQPFKNQRQKCLVFECFRFMNGRISDLHCIFILTSKQSVVTVQLQEVHRDKVSFCLTLEPYSQSSLSKLRRIRVPTRQSSTRRLLTCQVLSWVLVYGGSNSINILVILEKKLGRHIMPNLCQLFAQDWPNLRWGRFNNIEVNSINTLQATVL